MSIRHLTGRCFFDVEDILDADMVERRTYRGLSGDIGVCRKCYSIDIGKSILPICPNCKSTFLKFPISARKFKRIMSYDRFICEKVARLLNSSFTNEMDIDRLLPIKWSGLNSDEDNMYTKDAYLYDYDNIEQVLS